MTTPEPALGISQDIVGVIRRALGELGFDVAAIGGPTAAGAIVSGPVADALIDQASEYLLDGALGTSLAARVPIGSLGVLDYGLCTSQTVGDALARVVKYFGVATQRARLELLDIDGRTHLIYHRVTEAISRHWVEFGLAIIAMRIRQTAELDNPLRLHAAFRHPPPADRSAHDEFFGARVEFDAPRDELVFETAILDRPLATASQALAGLLEQKLSELAPATADPALDRIRRTLEILIDEGITDVGSLATRLETSRRTLQRQLAERGTSHSMLLDELRRQRAGPLLEQGLRIAEVATRLGFSEPSSFFRAYRRWTGTSPKAGSRAR